MNGMYTLESGLYSNVLITKTLRIAYVYLQFLSSFVTPFASYCAMHTNTLIVQIDSVLSTLL